MTKWIAGVAAALVAGTLAAAHSPVKGTDPADGAVLEAAPEVIRIEFDDAVRLVGIVLSGEGTETSLGVTGESALRHEVEAPELAPGSYAVEWRGMATDGHVMTGGFSFEVE